MGRLKTGQFAPGVSGNPLGKPKSAKDFEALAREKSPKALDRLMEIGRGRGVAAVKALEIVVAYGYGKPTTNLAVSTPAGPLDARFRGAASAALLAAVEEAERADQPDSESGSNGNESAGLLVQVAQSVPGGSAGGTE